MKTLFYNATFFSMADDTSHYRAILCENNNIIAIFTDDPPQIDCQKIDLHGTYVFPSFVDSHTHCFEGGLYSHGADLSTCQTISDVLDRLRETTPFSDMIFAFKYDENNVREKRFPTVAEIDAIFPNTPVLLRRVDGHSCVVNTAGLAMCRDTINGVRSANATDGINAVPTINIMSNSNNGVRPNNTDVLTGSQNDTAAHTFHKKLSDEAILQCYKTAEKIALKNGHTTLHTMIGDAKDDFLHFPLLLDNLKDFTIDYIPYPQCFNVDQVEKLYTSLEVKNKRIGGCILADGSFGSHTAALSESYIDRADCFGTMYQTQEFWDAFIQGAINKDMSTGVHCIGDSAIMQIIKAMAQSKGNQNLRHQLIHCEYVTDEMIPLIKHNNLYPVMQPMFDALWGGEDGFYASVISPQRVKYLNRFKSLSEQGITICGGSDWYVTELSALKGISAAVHHHNPNERLSKYEAVKMYTTNPYELTFEENTRGHIEVGNRADFVCLDKNILTTNTVGTPFMVSEHNPTIVGTPFMVSEANTIHVGTPFMVSEPTVIFTIKDAKIVYEKDI